MEIQLANPIHRCACGTDFCFECGARSTECDCPEVGDDSYTEEPRKSCAWTNDAGSLDAEVEIQSWPEHENVISNDANDADKKPGCNHSQAMVADEKSRCHGCLVIAGSVARCVECHVELCAVCLPQMSDSESDVE
jgi:hypothetical protein